MTWVARDKERKRNDALARKLLDDAWERAYLWLEKQYQSQGGIPQTDIAPLFGVSQPTISSWIAYARRSKAEKAYLPNAKNLLLLPQALGVNPMWLFYGIGEPTDEHGLGPPPSRDAALRGQHRLLRDLQEWVEEREDQIVAQLHQPLVAEVADTIASARRAARPIPHEVDRSLDSRDRPAGRGGDTPPRQSAAGE